ncbi:MAG: hypothetical protein HYY09_01275 [Firmicutes bacterium]|nr:hypothetical protein [Bacillota bacterium]
MIFQGRKFLLALFVTGLLALLGIGAALAASQAPGAAEDGLQSPDAPKSKSKTGVWAGKPRPGRHPAGTLAGEIIRVDGSVLTVKTCQGEKTAQVTEETKVIKGDGQGAAADLQAGVFVIIKGQAGEQGVISADQVRIIDPESMKKGPFPGKGRIFEPGMGKDARGGKLIGKITAVDGDTLSLSTPQGEKQVLLTEETIILKGREQGSASDLQVDLMVAVQGQADEQGVISAGRVIIKAGKGEGTGFKGESPRFKGTGSGSKFPAENLRYQRIS